MSQRYTEMTQDIQLIMYKNKKTELCDKHSSEDEL